MSRRKFDTYVPAAQLRWKPLQALWAALASLFTPRPSAHPTSHTQARHTAIPPIYLETPPHVWMARDRAKEARRLLRRYLEGKPTARRQSMADGMSDGAWRRARKILIRANVISAYDGRLLYGGRDAVLRLDVYLDGVEMRCWESGRFVPA